MIARPKQGAVAAAKLVATWESVAAGVRSMEGGTAYYNQTAAQLQAFAAQATAQAAKVAVAVGRMK